MSFELLDWERLGDSAEIDRRCDLLLRRVLAHLDRWGKLWGTRRAETHRAQLRPSFAGTAYPVVSQPPKQAETAFGDF